MLVLCSSLTAFAENADTNTSQPPQMGDGVTEGMPPEMPEGGFPGGPGGTPPEKPDGQPGGPGRPGGAPGNAPGRQQSHTEGQLGSWSMGGTNADGIEGDDYAYDAALYVTADGINEEKSTTDRIASGSYDGRSASGIVISDSESGHNGILVHNTDYTISDAEITMLTDADGSNTCDFSGKGTAIAAFGSDANVTITDSTIHTNGAYTGNIYNASGSDGLNGNALNVTFGAGAQYSGAIASTAAIHVTYDGSVRIKENGGYAFDDTEEAATFAEQYQNTSFTINEYWSIGQVANLVNDNGANAVNITLTDDAVWQVTGTSLISSLTMRDQAQVIIPEGIVLTVNGMAYTDCVLTSEVLQ